MSLLLLLWLSNINSTVHVIVYNGLYVLFMSKYLTMSVGMTVQFYQSNTLAPTETSFVSLVSPSDLYYDMFRFPDPLGK